MSTPPIPRPPHHTRTGHVQGVGDHTTQPRTEASNARTAAHGAVEAELVELRRALAVEVARRAFPIPDAAAELITATEEDSIRRQTRLLHVYVHEDEPLFIAPAPAH